MITIKRLTSKKTGKPFICAIVTNAYGKDNILTFDIEMICILANCSSIASLNALLDEYSGSVSINCVIS